MQKTQLFFDLDHTLWDFETNAKECLAHIFDDLLRDKAHFNESLFISTFSKINKEMWTLLERKEITHDFLRANRIKQTLRQLNFSVSESVAEKLNDTFLELLPNKTTLIENAIEVLDHCKSKYPLHIVSNGFYEIQLKKMKASGILVYFDHIVTTEKAGARKPSKQIFDFALNAAKCDPSNAVMIGDSYEADVLGAQQCGIKAIYFAEENKQNHTHHITNLLQLKAIL